MEPSPITQTLISSILVYILKYHADVGCLYWGAGGSVRLSTSIASDETKNAVPQVDSSRIPRPSSFRRRIPVRGFKQLLKSRQTAERRVEKRHRAAFIEGSIQEQFNFDVYLIKI